MTGAGGTRVVCAPNAFKGTLDAAAAARAMAAGVRGAMPGAGAVELPVADGGDGTLDVLLVHAGAGAREERITVSGPLGAPVAARLGWIEQGATAVVELAAASGLRLLPAGELSPLAATSRGAGELIRAALDGGARRILVGVGGSACTDGGAGLLAALGLRLLDAAGRDLPGGGGALPALARLDAAGLDPRLRRTRIEVAVDVDSPLLGPSGAAAVFAPQKGASRADAARLEEGLTRLAAAVERDLRADPLLRDVPGAGAAGGSAWGLAAVAGAALRPGAALVCDLVGLDAALGDAALVLTGEGRLDSSTAAGKAPAEVARRAARAGVPCVVLAGAVADPPPPIGDEQVAIGAGLEPEESMRRTSELLERAAAAAAGRWLARASGEPESPIG